MPFIFVKFGPSSQKSRMFNTDCTSVYLYDQIKEVAFSTTETYSRSKDAEIRQELNALNSMLASHRRSEPREDEEDPAVIAKREKAAAALEAGETDQPIDLFVEEQDRWCAELERLEAVQKLRENQSAQLLSGLTGFRDLNSPEAVVELHEDGDLVVPFPLKTDPLLPAR